MVENNQDKKDMFDRLMSIKKDLWDTSSIPVVVQGHYKINVESDEIESYTVLFSREEDVPFIKSELSFINE